MNTRAFSWHNFYLRWAGLVSACLGLIAFSLLIFSFRENVPDRKLALAISSLIGIFISYTIGKDIMDRIRNHEVSADMLSNRQTRLAYIGTRFGFALSKLILFSALASAVFFSIPIIERTALYFCWKNAFHLVEGSLEGCVNNFLR